VTIPGRLASPRASARPASARKFGVERKPALPFATIDALAVAPELETACALRW
jgi:hypothetical protein